MAMIACENLTRYYGSFRAVDRLTLNIERGAICALVGPNGAGKTTTMRMLATLLRPTRGHARIGGCDIVTQSSAVRRRIGYLPEAFEMYEDLSVSNYLHFFARAYSLDREMAENRIIDFLERLGLVDKRDVPIKSLSRGMRQRLGVAKSFLHDPDVAFLDEPASGLDPVARAELRDFLKHQQWMGKTVVISSHVLRELADFCDHIAIVGDGRLKEFGPLSGAEGVMARYTGQSSGGRRYTLNVFRDAPRLEVFLTDRGELNALTRRDNSFTFEVPGDDEAAAQLLSDIAGAGFLVTKFAPEEMDLEAVYRKASGGARD